VTGSGGGGRREASEPDFTEADERAWVAFACAAVVGTGYSVKDVAAHADRLLVELRLRRPAERKEGPYR
jgi:hypothetical protein